MGEGARIELAYSAYETAAYTKSAILPILRASLPHLATILFYVNRSRSDDQRGRAGIGTFIGCAAAKWWTSRESNPVLKVKSLQHHHLCF